MRVAALAIAFLASVAAAGCASLPRPSPPEVVGARVRVADARLPEVRLAVDLVMRNPNARDLAVDGLEATLALDGEVVGRGALAQPVLLPAHGDARIPLDVRGDASRLLARVGAALGAARPLGYEVRGTVALRDGSVVPFRRDGRLPEARTP